MHIGPYIAATFIVVSTILPAQNSVPSSSVVQLRQMLEASKRRAQLEMPDGSPFHLRASFQLFSNDGKITDTGTIDDLWKDQLHYRLAISQPGGDLLEINNDMQHWRTGNWAIQNRIVLAVNAALRPYYQLPAGDRLAVEKPPKGYESLDCIGTEPDLPGVGMDVRIAETTYCMSKGSHLLRLIIRPNGFSLVLNDTQQFEKKYIARSIELPAGNSVWIRLHIDSLETADNFSALDTPSPVNAQSLQGDAQPLQNIDAAGLPFHDYMLGQVLDSPQLRLPSYASVGHGLVVLHLSIDTSGHVTDAEVVNSSNKLLGTAAIDVVKNWRYRVAYQGDKLMPGVQTVNLQF